MKISKITFKNNQYILNINKIDYLVDEYVYKLILPYDNKEINKQQFDLIVAFSNAKEILKPLYKKIFQNKISSKMVYLKIRENIDEYYSNIIISTFQEDNYLNDMVFAQNIISKNQIKKSKKEIESLLTKEKVQSNIINKLLTDFEENDEFVLNYVKQKYRQNKTSNKMFIYKIRQQLLAKGFDEKVIQQAINQLKISDDIKSLAKDYKNYQKKYDNPQKIISKLVNKGYNVEDIKALIRKGDVNE